MYERRQGALISQLHNIPASLRPEFLSPRRQSSCTLAPLQPRLEEREKQEEKSGVLAGTSTSRRQAQRYHCQEDASQVLRFSDTLAAWRQSKAQVSSVFRHLRIASASPLGSCTWPPAAWEHTTSADLRVRPGRPLACPLLAAFATEGLTFNEALQSALLCSAKALPGAMHAASPAQGLALSSSEWGSARPRLSQNPRPCLQDGSLPRTGPAVLTSRACHSDLAASFGISGNQKNSGSRSSGSSGTAGKALRRRRPSAAGPSRGQPARAALGDGGEGGASGSPSPSDGDRGPAEGSTSGSRGGPAPSSSVSAPPLAEEQGAWSARHTQGAIVVHPTALVHPDAVLMEVRSTGLTGSLPPGPLLALTCWMCFIRWLPSHLPPPFCLFSRACVVAVVLHGLKPVTGRCGLPGVVRIEQGVEVGPFCTVGPLARLGRGCKLQTSSHVQGDTVLGDHCTLYTYATRDPVALHASSSSCTSLRTCQPV